MPEVISINDSNLEKLKQIGSKCRYGDWHIKYYEIEFFCHDLLALYTSIKDIFVQKIYDFKSDSSRPLVIDGGAHIGLFTIYAKRKYPNARVIAFEPDENNLKLFMKNMIVNGLKDVQVKPAGLYNFDGELSFNSSPDDGSSLFSAETNTAVKVVKLNPYIREKVDILKLNIEGAEWGVLKEAGDLLENIQEIVIEYHAFPELGQSLHNILALLDAEGFRYAIHDFDSQTNPATKPPINLDDTTRFFLLVKGAKLNKTAREICKCRGVGDILRSKPLSRVFGLDLGTPICRYYIESFLNTQRSNIRGRVLEVSENTYTMRFGQDVTKSDILHVQQTPNSTIVGNLETGENIPENAFDCIILTQTLQFIVDCKAVLKNCYRALRMNGVLIITATGIGQISRYDMDRWGEYWHFTDKCLATLLGQFFTEDQVDVKTFGNMAVAKAYLDGMPAEDIPNHLLDKTDNDYQVIVTGVAVKKANNNKKKDEIPEINYKRNLPRILMYHRVAEDPIDAQLLCVTPSNFEAQLAYLASNRKVLSLRSLVDLINSGESLDNCVALTFDDGYADNLINALPLLEKYQIHATIFICAGYLGNTNGFWVDQIENIFLTDRNLPPQCEIKSLGMKWELDSPAKIVNAYDEICGLLRDSSPEFIDVVLSELATWVGEEKFLLKRPVVSEDQLQILASSPYIEIGAHAMTHTKLALLPKNRQLAEIKAAKLLLQSIIKQDVTLFAYPFGTTDSFSSDTKRILEKEGFKAAVAVTQSDITEPIDIMALQRRVMRNWNIESFSKWMEADTIFYDGKAIEKRFGKLCSIVDGYERIKLADRRDSTLRIVHINTHDLAGGAAKFTCRLAEEQIKKEHRSDILVGYKNGTIPNVYNFPTAPDANLTSYCKAFGLLFQQYQGSHKLVSHHLIKKADIIHLQNLHGNYFNPYSVALLSNFRPVVWTLHDMQSITGHCAHAFNCDRWRTGCGDCPDLSIEPSVPVDSTAQLWREKKNIYKHSNLTVVCPSQWLKTKVEQSILSDKNIKLVYNSIDTNVFQPFDKVDSRNLFDLPRDAVLLGAVAHGGSLTNQWKGGQYTLKAFEELLGLHPNLYFVNIGVSKNEISENKNIINIPHVPDESTLARLYSALDLYLYTPLADNCPLVVIEALACGLPIVSFATGGIPDLVRQGVDGFVTPVKDIKSLVKAADILIKHSEMRNQFASAAREGALERFKVEDMAVQYETIYRTAIKDFWKNKAKHIRFDVSKLPNEIITPEFLQAMKIVWDD